MIRDFPFSVLFHSMISICRKGDIQYHLQSSRCCYHVICMYLRKSYMQKLSELKRWRVSLSKGKFVWQGESTEWIFSIQKYVFSMILDKDAENEYIAINLTKEKTICAICFDSFDLTQRNRIRTWVFSLIVARTKMTLFVTKWMLDSESTALDSNKIPFTIDNMSKDLFKIIIRRMNIEIIGEAAIRSK